MSTNASKMKCVTRAFPHEMFVNRLYDLNRQDEMNQTKTYRVRLCELCPQKYHDVVNSLDDDVIDVLDYIRVMYKPPMEYDQRIKLRQKVSIIVKSKEPAYNEHQMMFFIWVLRYYKVF
jgi:hypothetical protein